jgi:hypothetical protein
MFIRATLSRSPVIDDFERDMHARAQRERLSMKRFLRPVLTLAGITMGMLAAEPATAQDLFTGDRRLACEAVLCLASGQPPQACQPALRRYFSIQWRKPGDTVRERANFLRLCPASSQSPPMAALVDAMAAGAGACDPATLNTRLQAATGGVEGSPTRSLIANDLPVPCQAYTGNAQVDAASLAVRYVGMPERGGYWIHAAQWEVAQAAWLASTSAEDAAAQARGTTDRLREPDS